MKNALRLSVVLVVLAMLPLFAQTPASQLVTVRHATGQPVAPAYEGFDINDDGSYNMWFGYMNRNFEEDIDIPVGPENHFEPALPDRGQPTHFTPRRHKDVFSVTDISRCGAQLFDKFTLSLDQLATTVHVALRLL